MRHAAGGGPTPRPGDTLGYIATDLESAAVSDFVQVLLARLTAAAPAKTKHNRRKLGVTAAATEPPVVFCLSDADEDDDDRMEEKAAGRPAAEGRRVEGVGWQHCDLKRRRETCHMDRTRAGQQDKQTNGQEEQP